jgi:hypothetical protein
MFFIDYTVRHIFSFKQETSLAYTIFLYHFFPCFHLGRNIFCS